MSRGASYSFGEGLRWIAQGASRVWQRPLAWLLLTSGLFGLALLASMLPAVGNVMLYVLSPAILGALLVIGQQLGDGRGPAYASVRASLVVAMWPLLGLGVAYTLMQLGLLWLLSSVVPGMFDGLSPAGGMAASGKPSRDALPMLLMVVALSIPATLLMWFAPALVVFRRMGAWPAMRYSLAACIFHWRACLANGIGVFALLLLASLPAMLGLLLWVPVTIATIYTSYVAIFGEPEGSHAETTEDQTRVS